MKRKKFIARRHVHGVREIKMTKDPLRRYESIKKWTLEKEIIAETPRQKIDVDGLDLHERGMYRVVSLIKAQDSSVRNDVRFFDNEDYVNSNYSSFGSDGAYIDPDALRIKPSIVWKYDIAAPYGKLTSGGGYIYAPGTSFFDKITPLGNQVWRYNGHSDYVWGIAVDSDGNVYSASGDNEVHKVDPDGNKVWAYTEHSNTVRGVAVDSDGNVYTGSLDNEVHKINPDGTQEWTYNYGDTAYAVAVDSDGNVYVGGYNADVRKLDSDGNLVWTYSDPVYNVTCVVVDSDGFVYAGDENDVVHKINPDGTQKWTYTETSAYLNDIDVDSAGYVYTQDDNSEVHKISPDGNNVWIYLTNTEGYYGYGVTVDSAGFIYASDGNETVFKISPAHNSIYAILLSEATLSPNITENWVLQDDILYRIGKNNLLSGRVHGLSNMQRTISHDVQTDPTSSFRIAMSKNADIGSLVRVYKPTDHHPLKESFKAMHAEY